MRFLTGHWRRTVTPVVEIEGDRVETVIHIGQQAEEKLVGESTRTRTTIECDGCDYAAEVDGRLDMLEPNQERPLSERPGPWFQLRIDARSEEAYPIHSDLRGVDRIYCESCIRRVLEALDQISLVHALLVGTPRPGETHPRTGSLCGGPGLVDITEEDSRVTCEKCRELLEVEGSTSRDREQVENNRRRGFGP